MARGGRATHPESPGVARGAAPAAARTRVVPAPRRAWTNWAAVAGLLLFVLAFYTPLTTSSRILYDFDVWVFFYPLRQYAADALRQGRFPLWNPDVFLGSPFFANAQTALLYPFNVVYLFLPVPTAYTVSLWLHTWLAGAFTYLLARSRLGLSLAAALVAALAFSLGGFMVGLAGHVNQLQAAAWLPLLAWLLLGAIARRSVRLAALGALALAVQVLAGHSQEVYLTLVALGVVALVGGWRGKDRLRALAWALGLYALLVALGLALTAVQLLPTAEVQREGIRGGGLPYAEAISFSLPPPLLLRSLLPGFWDNPFGEYVGYVGTIPLCLGVLALAAARGRWVALGAALAGLGLVLAIGGYNPLYPLLYQIVPGLGLFRVPARWLFVYSFGMALLAGLGAEWAWRAGRARAWWRTLSRRRLVAVALVVGAALAAILVISPPLGARRYYVAWIGLGLVALALTALALARRRRLALGLLVAAVAAELVAASLTVNFRSAIPPDAYRAARPVLAPLLADQDHHRLLSLARDDYLLGDIAAGQFRYPDLPPPVIENYTVASKHDEVMTPNVPLEYGLATVDGYDGGVLPLARWLGLARALIAEDEPRGDGLLRHRLHYLPDERWLDLLDVRWVLTSALQDAVVDGVPFDRLATRRLAPGEQYTLPVTATPAATVALLSSVADASLPDGALVGRLTVYGTDDSAQAFDVRLGQQTDRAAPPGEAGTALPSAPPPDPRLRNVDYLVRLPLAPGTTVARLGFANLATTGTWLVRAATLLPAAGDPRPLPLTTALEPVPHDDPSPVKVYRARSVAGPARLVPEAIVADDSQALAFLSTPRFAPDRVATVAAGPGAHGLEPPPDQLPLSAAGAGGDSVRVVERAAERWTLETSAAAERLLVLTDAFFPGWEAAIDNQPAPLVRADYLFQGLYVPAGTHRVELRYRPHSLTIGLLVSLAAALVALALLLPLGRRPAVVRYQPVRLRPAPRPPAGDGPSEAGPAADD
ncbi:MAG TPA: YfhO family protein [Chloroflexota bacterium]|nr:YfhO family protein [Chloroflexota bacterium]